VTVIPLARQASSATVADDCSEFYARYRRPLVAYVAMSFPSVDAEGVVQEAFCRVLAHWVEVQQMRNPWPWLAVTARNLARNSIRDNANTQAVGLTIDEQIQHPAPEIDHFLETYDALRMLGRAMRELTPLQSQLLRLLVEEGLSGAEAARRLGLSPGAGRMHLCRMRSRLAERFLGLRGQLAVTPFAVVAMLGRRLHGLFAVGRRSMTMTAPAALASTLAIATSLGLVHIGVAHSHQGFTGTPAVKMSAANTRAASFASNVDTIANRVRSPRMTLHRDQPAPTTTLAVPAVNESHHVMLRKNPTAAGKNVDGSVTVITPVGSETVRVGEMQSRHSQVRRLCRSYSGGVCAAF